MKLRVYRKKYSTVWKFRQHISRVSGYEGLVFTVSIWREEKNDEMGHPKAEVVKSSHFPFMDMKMTWSDEKVTLDSGCTLNPVNNSSIWIVTAHTPLIALKQ
jgi:hypothetical protein